jgi:hypothetical protein
MDIQESRTRLDYPLYACDWDPQDAARLIVGGGGGASRTGVGNKIVRPKVRERRVPLLLTTSRQTLLNAVVNDPLVYHASEIELSKDEDNVTSLAVGQRKGRSTLVYAGVNSGPEDLNKGKNEHFRVFSVDQPSKARSAIPPKISPLLQTSLFTSRDKDTYQRLLRLSMPIEGAPQIGAVATGLSAAPQIALFDLSTAGAAGPRLRGKLELARDPVDLDITHAGTDRYQLAYCDDYDLFLMDLAKGSTDGPQTAYTITADEWVGSTVRPAFRCLRYLTPDFILAVANLPKRSGAVVAGFRLLKDGRARLSISAKLPKHVAQITGMAVRNLSPPSTASARQGESQFLVALAAADHSVMLYTVDHQSAAGVDALVNLLPLHTLRDVHELQITALAFSHFLPPAKSTSRTLHVKLASVSVKNTVIIHHIPLTKIHEKVASAVRRSGPPRQPRYVARGRPRTGLPPTRLLLAVAVAFAVFAALLQGLLEIRGLATPRLGAHHFTPISWHSGQPPAVQPGGPLAALLAHGAQRDNAPLVLHDPNDGGKPVVAEHDVDVHGPATTWEELPPEQRARWRARLQKAGHWADEMGESVFKGILFSEIAGAVRGVVGG